MGLSRDERGDGVLAMTENAAPNTLVGLAREELRAMRRRAGLAALSEAELEAMRLRDLVAEINEARKRVDVDERGGLFGRTKA